MDASQALADLTEISSQIEAAVLFDGDGTVQGSTLADAAAAEELVRDEARSVVATTAPDPTVGLVFYDLKSCLRGSTEAEKPKPKRRRPAAKPKEPGDEA
jgi:hypothetical protein